DGRLDVVGAERLAEEREAIELAAGVQQAEPVAPAHDQGPLLGSSHRPAPRGRVTGRLPWPTTPPSPARAGGAPMTGSQWLANGERAGQSGRRHAGETTGACY